MSYSLKNIIKGSALFSASQILTSAFGFCLIPLYTKFLTPFDYGIIGYLKVVVALLSTILMLGFASAQMRYNYEYDSKQKIGEFLCSLNIFLVIILLIFGLCTSIWGKEVYSFLSIENIPFYPYLPIVVWTICFQILNQMVVSFYLAQKRFKRSAVLQIMTFLLTTVFIIGFVVFLKQGAVGWFKGALYGNIVFFLLFYRGYAKHFRFHFSQIYVKLALTFGIPIVFHLLAGIILDFVDRIILERFISFEELGIYTLAYQIGMIMNIIVVSVNQVWKPSFYDLMAGEGENKRKAYEVRRAFSVWLLIVGIVCITGMLWTRELILWLTPKNYHPAAGIVPFVLFSYFLNGVYFFLATPIFYYKKTKIIPILTGLSASLNVILNFCLIPQFGVYGAAYATVFCFGFQIIIVFTVSNKLFDPGYPVRKIALILLFIASILVFNRFDQLSVQVEMGKLLMLAGFLVLNYFCFKTYLKPVFKNASTSQLLGILGINVKQ